MKTSENGKQLIKEHEGFRANAYPDPGTGGDPWTIGYGHTKGVKKGDTITKSQADKFLLDDLKGPERTIGNKVTVRLTQNQFDALSSFIFNLGSGNFEKSTLLRKLNKKDYTGAADEFLKWNKAGGRVLPGLTRRRKDERDLFLKKNK